MAVASALPPSGQPGSRSIAHIARRVTQFWHAPIPNSAELLIKQTRKAFEEG